MDTREEQLTQILLSFGLSKKEADVYVAILQLGCGTVSQISRKAGINRTTGYDILVHLTDKGLVSISGKEPKQEYLAESPDKLVALLDAKRQETESDIEKAKAFIPELKSIHKVGDRPEVRFYEGLDGLKQVYENTLTAHEPIRAFASVDDMHETLQEYFPKYYQRRAGAGISIKAVLPDTPIGIERKRHDAEEARESALVPNEKFRFHPEINIYDNKVMIASWREKLGIIIESAEIADAMKKIFELAWAEAKRLDAKREE